MWRTIFTTYVGGGAIFLILTRIEIDTVVSQKYSIVILISIIFLDEQTKKKSSTEKGWTILSPLRSHIHGGWKKSRPLKWTRVSRIHLSKFDDTMSKYVVRNKGTMAARGGNGRENWANISRERARNKAYNNRRWRSNKQPSVGNTPVVCNAPKTAPRQEITMTMNEIRPASGQFHSSFISPSHLRHPGLTYTHVSGRVDR